MSSSSRLSFPPLHVPVVICVPVRLSRRNRRRRRFGSSARNCSTSFRRSVTSTERTRRVGCLAPKPIFQSRPPAGPTAQLAGSGLWPDDRNTSHVTAPVTTCIHLVIPSDRPTEQPTDHCPRPILLFSILTPTWTLSAAAATVNAETTTAAAASACR